MKNWFQVKVCYDKLNEKGEEKKTTETYLFDALSYTEAEARSIEELTPFISGEFTIADIKRARFSETFIKDGGDIFYRVKVGYITLDEKSGEEKQTTIQMLVLADNLEQAIERLHQGMKGSLADYKIISVAETAILDVFPYDATKKEE